CPNAGAPAGLRRQSTTCADKSATGRRPTENLSTLDTRRLLRSFPRLLFPLRGYVGADIDGHTPPHREIMVREDAAPAIVRLGRQEVRIRVLFKAAQQFRELVLE